jgi:hypothetical protein
MTLPSYIAAHLGRPFSWGENDCVLFAIGWLELATGRDYLGAYKPWSSAREAIRKVDQAGGLESLFDAALDRIHPHMALDGDIAVVDRTAFLFSGPHIASVGESGLIFLNRMDAKAAWKNPAR